MYFNHRAESTRGLRSRLLRVELLERRDLLTVIRLVDWNTLNGPDSSATLDTDFQSDAQFRTVLQAIGNETVQGTAKRVDILALQETDAVAGGDNSIGHVTTILNGLYPLASYSSIATAADGGGDSTGFVYDTTTVSMLNSTPLTDSLTHNIMRAQFRPIGTVGESDFFVYSIHLKSGNAGGMMPDATVRANEAAVLRANADALGEGTHVLFVGDFNMNGSSEGAYTNFIAAGAAQLQDVADAPGEWSDNAAFKSLHSQDPRTTMDDRFDIQFATGEFFGGVGVQYVPDSFHIFGNNGTHALNGPITGGTGASAAVLSALVNSSDHLPAVGDYQFNNSTPHVRVTETAGSTKVIEGGIYDTYSVVLDTVPTADVTVTVTPDSQVDVGNGGGVPKVLTFTPANALTPQFVPVYAVDDAIGNEGNHTGVITHTSASADAGYTGLAISSINVKIVDNENPVIVINEVDTDTPNLPANDAAEFIELYDGGVGNVSLVGKTLVFFDGSPNTAYRVIPLTGSTDANGFYLVGDTGVAGIDQALPTSPISAIMNGPDAVALYSGSFTVGTGPTSTNLLDAVVYDNGNTVATTLRDTLTPGQDIVNENDNNDGDIESMSRVPDGGLPLQTTTYVAQAPTPKTFNKPRTGGVLITQSGGSLTMTEGGAGDSYQFALLTVPTANVTITVTPDGQSSLNNAGAGMAIMLMFTPANALIPQVIDVTAVDDAVVEGNHSSVISSTASSSDTAYNGLSIGTVVAGIVDNDVSAPTNVVITEIMYNPASSEAGPVGEWIEVYNAGTASLDLSGWKFDDEDGTNWSAIPSGVTLNSPNGTTLSSNQIAVLYDATFTDPATFRGAWAVPSNALVIGVTWGSLSNNPNADPLSPPLNEVLKLLDNHGIQKDLANFDDANPWPAAANGPSIYLKGWALDNNAGANWASSTLGSANAVSPPGPTFSTSDVGSPGRLPLPGDYNGNGFVDGADYTVWQDTFGSTTSLLADASGSTPGVSDSIVNQFDFTFWKGKFGLALGSGGESPGGGGGSLVESGATSPLALSLVSAAAPAPANTIAIDAAVSDFTFEMALPRSTNAAKPVLRAHALNFVGPSDLRMLNARHAALADHESDAPHSRSATPADNSQAVDELCASLGAHKRTNLGLSILL